MKKNILYLLNIFFAFSLAMLPSGFALAQYGDFSAPPTDIPTGPTDGSSMGAPANIPTGPTDAQTAAMQKGEEMQKQGEGKKLAALKKGMAGMERALKQFENKFAALEKSGMTIGDATREKINSIRTDIETVKNAQSASDIDNVDPSAIGDKISELGDEIGKYAQMQGLKKMLASMERGIKTFESRLTQLQKQGITAPTDITEALTKLKAGLQNIKDAKNPDELKDVDPDELGDLMTKINESRPQLEMLSKWPRVLKQADQQLKQFNKQLTTTKALVARLTAKGIDVTADLTAFQDDIAKLQTARDAADALIKAGQSEEAFTKMEDDFFNQLDNVGEHQRVIQMMSNLSRFTAQFKSGMAAAKKRIAQLAKAKVDTTELRGIFDQALAKGNEIIAMIAAKPINEEAILAAMDQMENLKQQFQDKADELGNGPDMPWETNTPSQFQPITLPSGFNKNLSTLNG